jgi:hypothetical protein
MQSSDCLLKLVALFSERHLGWSWLELDTLKFLRAQLGAQLGYFEDIWGWF